LRIACKQEIERSKVVVIGSTDILLYLLMARRIWDRLLYIYWILHILTDKEWRYVTLRRLFRRLVGQHRPGQTQPIAPRTLQVFHHGAFGLIYGALMVATFVWC
jgi:hypothetical protein